MPTQKNFKPVTKRGADTHRKVIQAAVRCIAEDGYYHSSTNKIAKAAGVTWGTLQHQFGDKARLLEATLEYCISQIIEQMDQQVDTSTPLENRVDIWVESIWQNQQTERNRAMQEILVAVQADPELRERFHPTLHHLRELYNTRWQSIFNDIKLPESEMDALKQLTLSALRGLAVDSHIRSSNAPIERAKAMLKETLVERFEAAAV